MDEKPPRKSAASGRFAAVAVGVDKVFARMTARLRDPKLCKHILLSDIAIEQLGRELGLTTEGCAILRKHLQLSDVAVDAVARVARGLAHDSTVDAYNQGIRDGRLRARLELGEPADELNVPTRTDGPMCPTCKRVID